MGYQRSGEKRGRRCEDWTIGESYSQRYREADDGTLHSRTVEECVFMNAVVDPSILQEASQPWFSLIVLMNRSQLGQP